MVVLPGTMSGPSIGAVTGRWSYMWMHLVNTHPTRDDMAEKRCDGGGDMESYSHWKVRHFPREGDGSPGGGRLSPREGSLCTREGKGAPWTVRGRPWEGRLSPAEGRHSPVEGRASPREGRVPDAKGKPSALGDGLPDCEGNVSPREVDRSPAEGRGSWPAPKPSGRRVNRSPVSG